jgi:hypothetical protein
MNYPTWKGAAQPTPADLLAVCGHCQQAEWRMYTVPNVHHHYCGNRMREATQEERKSAITVLKGSKI